MVLLKDVVDVSGRLLVPKGVVIGDAHLKVFRTWGVAEVDIESAEGLEEEKQQSIPAEFMARAEQELEKRLVHNDMANTFIKELHDIAVQHIATELMNEKSS